MNIIEINNLSHEYVRAKKALDSVNLQIARGKKIALIGANGSGKSTLLYYLNCLYTPYCGEVLFGGVPLTDKNADQLRMRTGYLFDNPDNQLFCPTVKDDIEFGLKNITRLQSNPAPLSDDEIAERGYQIAEKMDLLDFMQSSPMNLSLGQKKKVAIAGIVINQPELLIMDEPFSGLDYRAQSALMSILQAMESTKTTQIIATHNLDFVYQWADQIIVLYKGKVMSVGDRSILNDGQWLKSLDLKQPILAELFSEYTDSVSDITSAKQYLNQLINDDQ